jgi:superfamily II DNA or RNA helicase
VTHTSRRRFNAAERAALYLAADGHCARCGAPLQASWHADHVEAWSRGGPTDIVNGQALCPLCNLEKGNKPAMANLRMWQQQALEAFYAKSGDKSDFLVCATPGAGKTRFALHLAAQLLDQAQISRIIVIVPTDALRDQWADAAAQAGIELMPVTEPEDYDKPGYVGCVATYQQLIGAGAQLMRRATRRPTLAIIDEIHHAGENKSWGDSLLTALEQAMYRLCLTGTPWRRDSASPIPFVDYDPTTNKVVVDYAYEYGPAVTDGVCRRIEFHSYDGEAKWIDPSRARRASKSASTEVQVEFTAKLGAHMSPEDVSAALDTVYEPKHHWMPKVIAQADAMLTELRTEIPDAAGLVIAERTWHARGYADIIERMTGVRPPVVVSDPRNDPGSKLAKKSIDDFRGGTGRWIVAVKMISEGVDIPRLAVGVYASKTQTPLFFRQVVGRFVRTRDGEEDFNARLLVPAVPDLLKHAIEIEDELRHELDLAAEEDKKASGDGAGSQGELDFRTPLSASEATFDRAILGGQEVSAAELAAAEERCRLLGVPTRYAANLVPEFRKAEGAIAAAAEPKEVQPPQPAVVARHKREKLLRQEIAVLAGKYAHRKYGKATGDEIRMVNADLLRTGYPPRSQCSVEQLEHMLKLLERWLGGFDA